MADESLPPPRPPSKKEGGSRSPKNPYALMGVGMELAGAVVFLSLLGWWLDKRWQTSPWLLLVGMCIGLIGGFRNLWRSVKQNSDESDE